MNNLSKIKTIIFGGAFNPPTVAHEAILKLCVDYARNLNAEIWIVPSGNRSDKYISVERGVRIKYIKAMIIDVIGNNVKAPIKIITSELDRSIAVETFDTVQKLTKEYPDRLFIWVYGTDSIKTMVDWKNGQWLLENLHMLVFERQGIAINPLARNVVKLKSSIPNISSTEVRRRLNAGEPINGMVGESVKKLI